jgi:4-methyl-5(b-hydroxyethyl)-thiazole monophosphate biosynthesis
MARCCILFAQGFEEIEATTIVDVLRRADVEAVMLGLAGKEVTGAHGITMRMDGLLADAADQTWDLVVLPGGMPGASTLRDDPAVQALVKAQHGAGRKVAAICAAPIALGAAGLLEGRTATSYPGFGDQLTGATLCEDRVVVDELITTSRGPGTSLEFALELVRQLVSDEAADSLHEAMLVGARA